MQPPLLQMAEEAAYREPVDRGPAGVDLVRQLLERAGILRSLGHNDVPRFASETHGKETEGQYEANLSVRLVAMNAR